MQIRSQWLLMHVLILTSIENLGLTIYPNPSTGIFRYDLSDFEGDVNMTITDASGRLIETLNLTSVRIR